MANPESNPAGNPTRVPQARADPFTVVIKDGIRLGAYAVGGVNISAGELSRVDEAFIQVGGASGVVLGTSGNAFTFLATSGSGNIVTVQVFTNQSGQGELPAAAGTSSFPLKALFIGH